MKEVTGTMRSMGNITSISRVLLCVLLCGVLASCASTPRRGASGEYIVPLSNFQVSSDFGRRGTSFHKGLDMRADRGTPVAVTADGRVSFVGRQRGFGNVVIVDHGGRLQSVYGHLDGFAVNRGQYLTQGEVLGFVGRTGNATGYHLHFEMRLNGEAFDPAPMIFR